MFVPRRTIREMPKFDIPAEDNDSVNSSLLSLSSNENGSISNRSMASSISLGLNNLSPPPRTNEPVPSQIFNSLTNFQPTCRDPTLDAVLVSSNQIYQEI